MLDFLLSTLIQDRAGTGDRLNGKHCVHRHEFVELCTENGSFETANNLFLPGLLLFKDSMNPPMRNQ